MLVALVKWQDAVADEAENPTPCGAQLVEPQEVGFLLDENEEAIQLGMEWHEVEDVQHGRWRLTIPKAAIKSLRIVDVERAFPRRKTTRVVV